METSPGSDSEKRGLRRFRVAGSQDSVIELNARCLFHCVINGHKPLFTNVCLIQCHILGLVRTKIYFKWQQMNSKWIIKLSMFKGTVSVFLNIAQTIPPLNPSPVLNIYADRWTFALFVPISWSIIASICNKLQQFLSLPCLTQTMMASFNHKI